ncbi:beta-1,3-galactosyltransferase 5-like [Haliotis rubra]|uniref:beta-1,3-galactosyltransferase 5-like n=1 Tax=Haliotis rubra TaxID=36100 RepID=UPI001EE5CC03|nr:beta-1,3-galactosyltransferase 5-like [Haliotis rubra]XP_046573945.1 beta-1,3-galactosyltransferase 5-like [Haliotis rubra]XP_046573946.1 beta-1,3-galactosyltransferase 5-like [Haliotis rubra]
MPYFRIRILKHCALIVILGLFVVYIWNQGQTNWMYMLGRDIPPKDPMSKLEIGEHNMFLVDNTSKTAKIIPHRTGPRGHKQYMTEPKSNERHHRFQLEKPHVMKVIDGRNERQRDIGKQYIETEKTIAKKSINDVSKDIHSVKNKILNPEEVKQILANVQDWFHVKDVSQKDALLNRHEFVYHLNSKLCYDDIDLLIFVHSAPQNSDKRADIRNTWGSVRRYRKLSIATVFMCGETTNPILQEQLRTESNTFGDIVQGNFLDSYRNLTYKHVMALCWITSQCHGVRTVVKVDDDVLINIYKLVNYSVQTGHYHGSLYCSYFFGGKPIRSTFDKWYTPEEQYPFEIYPPYCEGMAYITSADEIKALWKASEDMKFYWVDDTFVTGILARKAGLSHRHLMEHHSYVKAGRVHETPFLSVLFFLEYKDWPSLWQKVVKMKNSFNDMLNSNERGRS